MKPQCWFRLPTGAGHYDFNMALDEAMLEAMPRLGRPVLRFYSWVEPAASFGYFQKHAEIEGLTRLRPLVRRPTGGGLVPHDADWTYSLAFPTTHEWYGVLAVESYRRVHRWLHDAFKLLGLPTTLAPAPNKPQPGQCFVGFEQNDLLWRGRKIAGAAQRRRRDGLLIQGSVQPPDPMLPRPAWERALCDAASQQFGVQWTDFDLPSWLSARSQELARTKYSQSAYNQKR